MSGMMNPGAVQGSRGSGLCRRGPTLARNSTRDFALQWRLLLDRGCDLRSRGYTGTIPPTIANRPPSGPGHHPAICNPFGPWLPDLDAIAAGAARTPRTATR
jgi:hypothetical protein